MSITSPLVCNLGVTHDTLSALRDSFFAPATAERLRAHIATCEACQKRLADFDALAHELQGQRVPSPDGRLWDAVAKALMEPFSRRHSLPIVNLPKPSREVWGALGAAAAVLLVVVAFARVLSRPTTSVPTNPLSWREVTLPADFTAKGAYTSIGLAPGGQTAYACVLTPGLSLQASWIWVTRDGGAHWQHATKFLIPDDVTQTCAVLPDEYDPNVAIASYFGPPAGVSPGDQVRQTHATFDGGATWSDLGAGLAFTRLATRQGLTYAVMLDQGAKDTAPHLVVSIDHFQSSKPEDDVIVAAGHYVTNLWRDLTSNAVLAQTNEGTLWESAHGNQGFTELRPPYPGSFFAVAQAGGGLLICGDNIGPTRGAGFIAFCSTNFGQTWSSLPDIGTTTPGGCSSGLCPQTDLRPLGVATDGAVLVALSPRNASGGDAAGALYRASTTSSEWESLGSIPTSADQALLAPASPVGETTTLWAFSAGLSDSNGPQGLAGPGAHVYTALYPPGTAPSVATDTTATPQPSPSPALLPAQPLTWTQTGQLPDNAAGLVSATGLVVAPADGATAYWCGATRMTSPTEQVKVEVWATRDGGATWSAPVTLPSRVGSMPADAQFDDCALQVDQLVPTTALATLSYSVPGEGAGFSGAADYATFDGGKSWRQVAVEQAAMYQQFQQLASVGSTIYALRWVSSSAPPDGTSPYKFHVYASTDQMRSWQRVDGTITGGVQHFWIDPASRSMLIETGVPEGDELVQFYTSADHGATWTPVIGPVFDTARAQWTASGVWRICTAALGNAASGRGDALNCSADGGKTWVARPDIPVAPSLGQENWIGLADDGAILTVMASPPNTQAQQFTLYRLSPGAAQWQSLGVIPAGGLSYSIAPSDGVLTILDAQSRVLTAPYAP